MSTTQNFVGNKIVDEFDSSTLQKPSDDELTRKEVRRDPRQEPGANKREGVATKDPKGTRFAYTVAHDT